MKIKVIASGRIKERLYKERIHEYIKWIKIHNPIDLIFMGDLRKLKYEKQPLSFIKDSDYLVCLSEEGIKKSSVEFSTLFCNMNKDITFIIGGPDGLNSRIKNRANLVLSLSDMTFLHEMAVLILVEQIYRGLSIKVGSNYHR